MLSEIKNRKLALLTDLYELLMMQGYFKNKNKKDVLAVFDIFYRRNPYGNGFCVFCGLTEIIDYISSLKFDDSDISYLKSTKLFEDDFLEYLKTFRWHGSIYSFLEGDIINKKEPIIKIKAPLIEAQLIESAILSIFNHETLIATKAYRVCTAAIDKSVMEFGLRRAHSIDASIYGAKAAVIAGCIGTSNMLTAKMFDVLPLGTQAHSWIMSYDNEYDAFYAFAKMYPDMSILLVDTYDTLKSGVPNAIKVFKDLKKEGVKFTKYGIRLDSGDLAYLSKQARIMLDEAGFTDALICASNDLDENVIQSLNLQGAKIDLYGVGTKLITGEPVSSLGGVYKMSAIYDDDKKNYIPKIKISENTEKVTNPGDKEVYRIYDLDGKVIADYIALIDEDVDNKSDLVLFDPVETWKKTELKANEYTIEKKLKPIFVDGELVYKDTSVLDKKKYFELQKTKFYENHLRLVNPKEYHVDLSQKLYDLKMKMLSNK